MVYDELRASFENKVFGQIFSILKPYFLNGVEWCHLRDGVDEMVKGGNVSKP